MDISNFNNAIAANGNDINLIYTLNTANGANIPIAGSNTVVVDSSVAGADILVITPLDPNSSSARQMYIEIDSIEIIIFKLADPKLDALNLTVPQI